MDIEITIKAGIRTVNDRGHVYWSDDSITRVEHIHYSLPITDNRQELLKHLAEELVTCFVNIIKAIF